MQDVIDALIVHLKTVTAVTDLTSTRIYGGEIPEDQLSAMPQKLIVLRYAGGYERMRTHREQQPRVLIYCYGEGYYQAGQVDRAVSDVLIGIQTLDVNSTMIYSVAYGGGPRQQKDPDPGWRHVVRTAIVRAGETATV